MKKPTYKKKKKGTRKKSSPHNGQAAVGDSTLLGVGTAEDAEKDAKKSPAPAPVRKEPEKKGDKKAPGFKYFSIVAQFLREAKTELKKVKWPSRKELFASTAVVIVLVIVVALFLGLIDLGLIKIIKNIVG